MAANKVGLKVDQAALELAIDHCIGLSSLSLEEQHAIDVNNDGNISLEEMKPLIDGLEASQKISPWFKHEFPTTAFHAYLADRNGTNPSPSNDPRFFTILGEDTFTGANYLAFLFEGGLSEPTLQATVDEILTYDGPLEGLKIYSHGYRASGFRYIEESFSKDDMEMSERNDVDTSHRIIIDEANSKIRPFVQLRGHFAMGARVMFSACYMAKSEDGKNFIKGLSELLEVRVEAPMGANYIGRAWLQYQNFEDRSGEYAYCQYGKSPDPLYISTCGTVKSRLGDIF